MGLFDSFSDPNDAAYLALAAGLLGGRGNLGSIVGKSLMGAQGVYQDTAEAKRRGKLAELQASQLQMQLEQAQQQKKQQAILDQFRNTIPLPGVGPDGMGPSNASPNELLMHSAMRAGALNPLDYIKAQQKDNTPITLAPGAKLLKPGTFETLAENPKEDATDPFVRLLKQAGIDPASPQGQALLAQRLKKESSHQEPVSINNFGSPLPVDIGGGKTGYIQPPTRPGGPSQILNIPGTAQPAVKPAETREKDLTADQAKATTFLGQMRSASETLRKLGMDQSALSLQAETALAGGPMNLAIGQKAQQVRQSQDQWSEAFLRFKTGAASTKDEVAANRKTFFPVIGDRPETVAQKAQMRAQAERDMEVAAGRGTAQLDARDPPKVQTPTGKFRIIEKK